MFRLGKQAVDFKKFFVNERIPLLYVSIFVLALLINIIFSPAYYLAKIREGEISLRTVYAPYDFEYPWCINETKTEEARQEINKTSALVFNIDSSREENAMANLIYFFDNVGLLNNIQNPEVKKLKIEEIKEKGSLSSLKDYIILYFADIEDKQNLKAKSVDMIRSVYPLGIIDSETKKGFLKEDQKRPVKIRNEKVKTERVRSIKDVFTQEDTKTISIQYLSRLFPNDDKLRNYMAELISALIVPNLILNEEETRKIKEEAIKNMSPVYDMVGVKKNELIVERGQRVAKQHVAQLTQLDTVSGITHKGPYLLGILLLLILIIIAAGIYLYITERKIINSPRAIAIILVNSFIIILIGQFLFQFTQSSYLIPLCGTAILITLLVSSNAALIASMALSIFLGIITGGKIDVIYVLLIGSIVSIYVARDARRRSRIIIAGIAGGLASFAAAISGGLINNLDFKLLMGEGSHAIGGGIVSVFLVMGLLPLFEYLFKVTINITLLELSDLNHPLLKELTLRAPGTYQHSIVVGNLAEAACEAIGANSLLARVGSYYHDIGKIGKAEYFSENEMGAQSKHEKLTPSMSALIIINHVKDGVELARKHNLNPKIIDFIAQHHGTSLIYYFYQRALEKVKDDQILKEEEFRYPGPKPQTKEAAVVLLADSVEASSRALSDPVPARIRGLVQKIINNKFIDNQLDDCDLTLKDLNKIAFSFVRVLTAVFHARLEYPERKSVETKRAEAKGKKQKSK